MIKKYCFFLFAFFLLWPTLSWAQTQGTEAELSEQETSIPAEETSIEEASQVQDQETDEILPGPIQQKIRPVIRGEELIKVNRNIIFDGSSSFLLKIEAEPVYRWDLGDGTTAEGQEVVHTYAEPGTYTVRLSVTQAGQTQSATHEIFVYNKLALLLTDQSGLQENFENLKAEAAETGTHLFIIDSYEANNSFASEDALYTQLNDNISALLGADNIAIWTSQNTGINALNRLIQQSSEKESQSLREALQNKTLLVITEENINTLSRILQGSFNIIHPKQIIIARQYELKNFITIGSDQEFVEGLQSSLSDYAIVNAETGKATIWNSMSYLVSYMISQGIPSNTLILLLMLPVIATVISFLKQVIGITTFGIYTPSIITLSFLALGWELGLILLFIIIVTGALAKKLMSRFNLLHIPRVAIILTFSTLVIFLSLALGTYLGFNTIITIAVFPMLIMTTLSEKFVTALGGKSLYAAFLLMLETMVVSLLCFAVVQWQFLQNLVLGHPEIILLLLLINYILGRWTGLRLMEYIRFREVMKNSEE